MYFHQSYDNLCQNVIWQNADPMPAHAFDNDPYKELNDSTYFKTTGYGYIWSICSKQKLTKIVLFIQQEMTTTEELLAVKKVVIKTIGSGSTKQIEFENGEI